MEQQQYAWHQGQNLPHRGEQAEPFLAFKYMKQPLTLDQIDEYAIQQNNQRHSPWRIWQQSLAQSIYKQPIHLTQKRHASNLEGIRHKGAQAYSAETLQQEILDNLPDKSSGIFSDMIKSARRKAKFIAIDEMGDATLSEEEGEPYCPTDEDEMEDLNNGKQKETLRYPAKPWMKDHSGKFEKMYGTIMNHTNSSRSCAMRLVKMKGKDSIIKLLLSGNEEKENQAIDLLGRPKIRQKGKRTILLGDEKNQKSIYFTIC